MDVCLNVLRTTGKPRTRLGENASRRDRALGPQPLPDFEFSYYRRIPAFLNGLEGYDRSRGGVTVPMLATSFFRFASMEIIPTNTRTSNEPNNIREATSPFAIKWTNAHTATPKRKGCRVTRCIPRAGASAISRFSPPTAWGSASPSPGRRGETLQASGVPR
jgi:hypothetical protein